MSSEPPTTFRARYVFPVDGPPIAEGVVHVLDGRIAGIGAGECADVDFGNAALLPGFVNAHTHLELSDMGSPPPPAASFAEFLDRVVTYRRSATREQLVAAVERGIVECLRHGVTLVGDISTGGSSGMPLARSPLCAVVFCELIGLRPERQAESYQAAHDWLASLGWLLDLPSAARPVGGLRPTVPVPSDRPTGTASPVDRVRPSLSPHAPYSTARELYDVAARYSVATDRPIATHLAETREELDLLSKPGASELAVNSLRDFLARLGAWTPALAPQWSHWHDGIADPTRPAARWLLAHGNYLEPSDWRPWHRAAAEQGRELAVAYCPRTHRYFGHAPHPFREMLADGVCVCLGTDSLASNPSLSILDEVRFLHRQQPDLAGALLLRMATWNGAVALGWESEVGSLGPGKRASFAVVPLPDRQAADPHLLVWNSEFEISHTVVDGRLVSQPDRFARGGFGEGGRG